MFGVGGAVGAPEPTLVKGTINNTDNEPVANARITMKKDDDWSTEFMTDHTGYFESEASGLRESYYVERYETFAAWLGL